MVLGARWSRHVRRHTRIRPEKNIFVRLIRCAVPLAEMDQLAVSFFLPLLLALRSDIFSLPVRSRCFIHFNFEIGSSREHRLVCQRLVDLRRARSERQRNNNSEHTSSR